MFSKHDILIVNNKIFTELNRLLYLIFFFVLFTVNTFSQVKKLSENAKITLLTCTSGNELYSVFGHSAIRVTDESLDLDVVFNYGTFDFNTPYFYLKFMNGNLDYALSAYDFDQFMRYYEMEKRGVEEGILELDSIQKEQLWEYLIWNLSPNNRNYRYDFFFDNCATRIRDIIFKAKQIDINNKLFTAIDNRSFRDYIHSYVNEASWTGQGIDLLLGMKTDEKASVYQRAYLPDYLDSLFVDSKIIVNQTVLLKKGENDYYNDISIFSPNILAIIILILSICISIFEFTNRVYCKFYDIVLFTACGLLSILFWYLWLFTKHEVCSVNINVMWASILYIPVVVLLCKNKIRNNYLRVMTYVNMFCTVMFILLSWIDIQDTPSMAVIIAFALMIRSIKILSVGKR